MEGKVKCSGCGWSWNKSDSSKKDMYVCHQCGKDNTMKNGGWLNKYDDGGDVQPNYNDASVSMSDDFVGLGYDTKGRDYSPAWGGQFEEGGIIPIAQGGVTEYMNKKMQEEKDRGIAAEYNLPEVVVSAPYLTEYNDPNKPTGFPQYEAKSNDIAEFYKSWVSSPEYERRMKNTGYYTADDDFWHNDARKDIRLQYTDYLTPIRAGNMGRLESTQEPGFIEIKPVFYKGLPASVYTPSGISIHPGHTKTPEILQTVTAHEIAHAIDNDSSFERQLIKDTMLQDDAFYKQPQFYSGVNPVTGNIITNEKNRERRGMAQYVRGDAQEFKSDLNALRFLMFDKGIYDIRKGKEFTKEDLEKAKEKLKDNESLLRTIDAAGESGFIKLMNVIAKGKEDVVPVAMGGMSIPGSVGFTYARTAGSAPSEGKYAKKTMASAQNGKGVQKNKTAGGVDSTLENIFEIIDPSGMSSWDDVYKSYQETGMSPQTELEIFGALPLLGKVGKFGKILGEGLNAAAKTGRQKTNVKLVSNILQSIPYMGRGTDATQAVQQYSDVPFFPTAPPAGVGQFGRYAGMPSMNLEKKEYGGEIPSAQNGIMSPMLLARNVLNYFYPNEETTPAVEAAPVNYKKGLTNELLQRQAYKESTFNPAAVSPAGYKGLTQIGEGVLQDYSNKKGGKKLDPFNPEDAVELQKFAMDDLYNASFINKPDQSDSVRIAKTLAAYNWGRGNLANYLNEQKSKGVDIYDSYDWLNNLPKETSDYVNKILLQEDPSFNKNYKKASTNPKYEEVTSLYDQKKFGGEIPSAQGGKNDVEKISINDPRYPEMYKNRQVGLLYDDAISLPDLDEVVITAPRSYTMDSLRDFTTAALYGIPENLAKLEQVPTAALAETAAMLTGKPYNFSNVNPNLGQFGSNQRDLSVLGYENPQGFLQNAANTALSAIDPSLIVGGASMLRKPLQKKLAKSFSKNFKSEINWGNWNKEIPENTQLMKEYNAIEQTSKANGSWMKYSDGSNFNGTPEQFIQMKHPNTQNFAGGALEAEQMYKEPLYRGAHKHVVDFKNRERNDYATFLTNNEKNAETYATSDGGVKKYFHPDIDKEVEAYGKSYPLDVDGKYQLSFPQNLPIVEGKANGNNWRFLDYDKEIDPKGIRAEINRNSFENNLGEKKKYQYDYPENFDIRNNYLSTDDYANYVKNNPIGIARIKNVKDQMGYVKDILANTVYAVDAEKVPIKSLRYNSGMFDVTNPNIYKGVVPAGIATALSIDQQRNGGYIPSAQNGQEMKFYQNGLDWKPKSMQPVGNIERVSTSDPRYPELYKNRQIGAYYDGAYSLPDLDEVTVTAPRSYTMDSLRDFTTAALYGAPANTMKLSMIPQAAMTEGVEALRGEPYDFSNVNPNFGGFTSNQRDLSQTMGYENPEGFAQNAVNFGLSMVDPLNVIGLGGARNLVKPSKSIFTKFPAAYDPRNLKTQSGLDWSKRWYEHPELLQRKRKVVGNYDDDAINKAAERFSNDFVENAKESLNQYEPKSYIDLLKDKGSKDYFEYGLNTGGLSYGTPDQIYINRPMYFPFDKKGLESVRVHELSHLVNRNGRGLTSPEENMLLKPLGFQDGLERLNKLKEIKSRSKKKWESYYTDPTEIKARMDQARFDLNLSPKDKFTPEMFDKISKNNNFYGMGKYIKDKDSFVDLMNKFWAVPAVGVAVGAQAADQQKNGGITKDNQGYWNPNNWGKPVEIDSNNITMQGVYEPLLGVSDTGDTKLMKPGKNYKFKGKKVREYPVGKLGINQLDAQPMKKLNQLLNFTNNPDKDNWLDKYN